MPKLRQTIICQIYSALENSSFSLRDFKVDVEGSDYLVHIVFVPRPQYEFSIVERDFAVRTLTDFFRQTPPDIRLATIESPGEYRIEDTRKHDSIEQCIGRIAQWCQNIKEDLSARIHVQEELEEFETEMERRINEAAAGDSQEKFSESEVSSLSQKLDSLAEKFEELERANTITEKELAEVRAELEKMKGTLPIYPKSTWYKTAGHKLMDEIKRILTGKVGHEFLLALAKKFFLGQD